MRLGTYEAAHDGRGSSTVTGVAHGPSGLLLKVMKVGLSQRPHLCPECVSVGWADSLLVWGSSPRSEYARQPG